MAVGRPEGGEGEREREDASKQGVCGGTSKGRLAFAIFLIVLTAVALAVGLTLNALLQPDDDPPHHTAKYKIDCHPDQGASKDRCTERGCLWWDDYTPKCSFPEKYGYVMAGDPEETASGFKVMLKRISTPPLYGMTPDENLTVLIDFHSDHRLRIKIFPTGQTRYEIPSEALDMETNLLSVANETTRLYDVTFHSEPVFGINVTRRSTNATIFNTGVPGMALYPQFLQLTTLLPAKSHLYGFGEHRHQTFRHDMNFKRWSMFTRDLAPENDWNLYGAHPVYMNVEEKGQANMVFLKNSNAMEVFLQPDPSITFRTIGGVLDFYIFLGDSPNHAVSLYTEAIGRPVLPPYWALGYQLSRWGYTNLTDMKMVVERNRAAGIPYDVQWADIDSFYQKVVFTVDKEQWAELPDLVKDLKDHHQHFVVIVDPGVASSEPLLTNVTDNSPGYHMYLDGTKNDVYVKDENGDYLVGEVWPGLTVYPDFTNASVLDWYTKYINFYRNNESVDVDALWIDMNEPSNFKPGSVNGCGRTQWDFPPYVPHILGAEPEGKMFDKTLCMSAQQAWGRHYDVHSLYGHSMSLRTNQALRNVFPGKRPWTMTRSSFAGTGHYATKWMGDNQARWSNMHWSIIGIMEFSMFGFALNGADICGFWYETTYELCIRWHQLGAFYPFARNHNAKGDPPEVFMHQDPAAFDQRFVDIVKRPLMTRYRLLPYLYTCMYRAHLLGDTVMRPLLFEFPVDMKARDIDRQFLLGPALLVSPVLEPNKASVDAYFPLARWFEYSTGEEVQLGMEGKTITLDTPLDKYNLHVRGGYVIPWQRPSVTTYESRMNPMGLIVALDKEWKAQGELYLDDGETDAMDSYTHIAFTMEKAGELKLDVVKSPYTITVPLDTVEIYGLTSSRLDVTVDGQHHPQQNVRFSDNVVQIISLNLTMMQNHTITWAVY
ncbi:sucrase-isomaltase, intestinal-like [Babylonia areolata]|uniref:sucrase-isomaltase, intestinal-like n=1 Tax=Babylonia areolata TaxID=304850 RepID=UPI003FD4380C